MHFKKTITFLISLIFISSAEAKTLLYYCPTVTEIKQGQFGEWIPLYQDNEEWASDAHVAEFKKAVTHFKTAHWGRFYLETGHCFYRGNDPIMEKIVFAQDTWHPGAGSLWQWTKPNILAECHSEDPKLCDFEK